MDMFVEGCDINSNEEGIQYYCLCFGVELNIVKHLTTKCEWYKAYRISMKVSDREKIMKPESWPECIFVRKYFKARTGRNSLEQEKG